METKGLEEFVKYLKNRAYDLSVRAQFRVRVSVYFNSNGKRNVIVQDKDRKMLSVLAVQAMEIKPNIIDVEIEYNGKVESHSFNLNYSGANEKYREFNGNNRGNNEIYRDYTPVNEMSGLGNASSTSIESIVNKRLDEERKERELAELKLKIEEDTETLTKKTKKIEGLQTEIESKDLEIEDLKKTIENKQNFKYYAGLTGDILQSFGIKKEAIATPLAGLLSGGKEDEPKAIAENSPSDESGIVEEGFSPVQSTNSKRDEMIALISEYLKGIDNNTLSNVFSIFSEIENDPNNSNSILEFLKQDR